MNLAETYAAVCAKRPELAVMSIGAPGVRMYYDAESFGWYWDDPAPKHIGDRFAAAMILARWVEALPACYGLMHGVDHCGEPRWWVGSQVSFTIWEIKPTPLEALAAYWLEETT